MKTIGADLKDITLKYNDYESVTKRSSTIKGDLFCSNVL